MRVLVLGGTGFIGSRLRAALESTDHDVSSVSRREGVDLLEPAAVRACLADLRPEAIFHLAAHVGSLHYVTQRAAEVLDDNMTMALNLYRAIAEVCPEARVVNPLSNCSYPGDSERQREGEWWHGEVHDTVFSYGNAKKFLYVVARNYRRQHGIRSLNFLVPNTFGPGDSTDPNRTHALNGMILRMIEAQRTGAEEFEVWGTGRPVREWGYVDDVVAILTRALSLEEDLTYPVNLAQNRGYSIGESAELIARAVGYRGRLTFNSEYADGDPVKVLDDTRFRELFPDFEFHDHFLAIQETVAYYRQVLS